jgi:DNA invertase Pin-like site-specific DNA recombinase
MTPLSGIDAADGSYPARECHRRAGSVMPRHRESHHPRSIPDTDIAAYGRPLLVKPCSESYAKAAGFVIVDWFYDPAVKGSDPVNARPGFAKMLDRIAGNGVRTIVVESPDQFARDLAVQLAGHDFLKKLGVTLIPATAPDFFLEDTPTAVLVRQVLGAIAQFEKASLVAKLKAARDRKIAAGFKCGGRKSYAERSPELVAAAKALQAERPRLSLRQISARLAGQGFTNKGRPYAAMSVSGMLRGSKILRG